MNHLMIDLETLGTKSNSIFLSLAAIQFNIDNGFMGKVFNENVSLESGITAGLTMDAQTLKWWLTQRPNIMAKMFEHPAHLANVLVSFSDFIQENSIQYVWGNSARFDLGLLNNAYDKMNIAMPWKFWDEMDYRTLKNLFPQYVLSIDSDKDHDPLWDCEKQIKILANIWKHIRPTPIDAFKNANDNLNKILNKK